MVIKRNQVLLQLLVIAYILLQESYAQYQPYAVPYVQPQTYSSYVGQAPYVAPVSYPTSYTGYQGQPYGSFAAYPTGQYAAPQSYAAPMYTSSAYAAPSAYSVPYAFDIYPPFTPWTWTTDPVLQNISSILAESSDHTNQLNCPNATSPICDPYYWYRQPDGSCNNLVTTWWGQSNTPYKRLLNPSYQDGRQTPRKLGQNGRPLKSPREIATKLHSPDDKYKDITHYVPVFGQFVMHDVTRAAHTLGPDGFVKKCNCISLSKDCVNIEIPKNDYHFKDKPCLIQIRDRDSREDFNCDAGYRNQLNEINSFLDLSNIYGNTKEE